MWFKIPTANIIMVIYIGTLAVVVEIWKYKNLVNSTVEFLAVLILNFMWSNTRTDRRMVCGGEFRVAITQKMDWNLEVTE